MTDSKLSSNSRPQRDDAITKVIGPRLRATRQDRGLSMQEVAEATDISTSFLSLVETGRSGLVAEYAWLDPLKVAQGYGCEILALNWTLCTPERLQKAQRQGLHVSVWTVNEPALMRRLADFGVDSLITDFPGLATATLENC